MRSRLILLACTSVLAAALAGCLGAANPDPVLAPSEPFGLGWIELRGPDSVVPMHVWIAASPESRRLGLMHREHLEPDAGMVFLFDQDMGSGFWMRNTLIPLSIAFFDSDGEVLEVLDMEPCRADPCPVYDPQVPYRGALEANQGYFDEIGLEPGWTVDTGQLSDESPDTPA